MKVSKKLSLMLICVMILNLFGTFTVFAQEDITSDSMEFAVNSSTITALNSTNTATYAWGTCVAFYQDGWIDYTVNTEAAKSYKISIKGGTANENMKFAVSVGGTEQISATAVTVNGDPNTYVWSELGTITLAEGPNVIRLARKAAGSAHYMMGAFKLEAVNEIQEDITSNPIEFKTNTSTVSAVSENNTAIAWPETVSIYQNGWFEYTVNTATAEEYRFSVNCGTSNSNLKFTVSVNESAYIQGVAPTITTGNYDRKWTELGKIKLTEGENVIRIKSSASECMIDKIKLEVNTEDITSDPVTFATNMYTIGNTTVNTPEQLTYAILISYGRYFEYSIRTEEAANYVLSVNAGTPNNNCELDIFVNDAEVISNMAIPNTGSHTGVTYEAGRIRLHPGTNTLKFVAGGLTHASVYSFTLTKSTEDITGNPTEFAINKYTIGNTSIPSGDQWSYAVTIGGSNYFEYNLTTQKAAYYKLTMQSASDRTSAADVYVNGIKYIEAAGITNTNGFNTSAANEMGTILLAKGENTIKIQGVGSCYFNVSKLTLTLDDSIQYVIEGFKLQNENGVRPTYVINGGEDIYAVCDFKLIDTSFSDTLWLMIAQYNDNKLIEAQYSPISTANMASFETKQFKTKITLDENSTTVKGFLMKADDLTPVAENIGYTEVEIFSQDILNEGAPAYAPASEILNNDGGYYTGYDINNGTYDIDAIFYDSEVGDQTKVFAYMGVPKTDANGNEVSASNKVPAVVLVHGGAGYAFIDWVKKWNDRGVAAIAMSLTGDGPDATGAKTAIHPYAGQMCWDDNGKAFLKDFKNASMYQTVLNVIRAHNLIRSLDTVDENNTAITGISWGGITTTTVIGVDNRFKFAIPCYGTGYLDESRTYFKNAYTASNRSANWDPANFAANAEMPVLYVNGDSDEHFSLNITTLTSDVTPNSKISVHHKLVHGYDPIWNMEMIYKYAANMFNDTDPLIEITNETAENGTLTFDYSAPQGTSIASATMYYITTDDLGHGGAVEWTAVTTFNNAGSTISFDIPDDATHCYASVVDNNGYTVSTRYLTVK